MSVRIATTLLLCFPMLVYAQYMDGQWPLPKLKDVSMVVKVRHNFTYPLPTLAGHLRDTEAVFLVSPDGLTRICYRCSSGSCVGKELYEYKDGLLLRRTSFSTLDQHTPFAPAALHSHRQASEETWIYENGKLSCSKEITGPTRTLAKELRYHYDAGGRLMVERRIYPKQCLLYYTRRYDSISYHYAGDSVFKNAYKNETIVDIAVYIERHNPAGLIAEVISLSQNREVQDRELFHYDTSNRLSVYECLSTAPVLDGKGHVLRADRIEYSYDEKGRLEEERYFAQVLSAGHIIIIT